MYPLLHQQKNFTASEYGSFSFSVCFSTLQQSKPKQEITYCEYFACGFKRWSSPNEKKSYIKQDLHNEFLDIHVQKFM